MNMTTYTADEFLHAHFAMHPITGSVASKGRMDWEWVLPGWYKTGDVSRLSDQRMAEAGWYPVRECPDPDQHAAESRPLTPDAITDEMVERGMTFWRMAFPYETTRESMISLLTAALTDPPARPEGAEELARLIADADVGEWDCGDLADALLATGRVRVIPKEDPR